MKPKQEFQRLYEKYRNEQQKLSKKTGRLAWARLIIFLTGFGAVYASTFFSLPVLFIVLITFITGFLRVVYLHHKVTLKKQEKERLIQINENEMKALEHDFSTFEDGHEFQDSAHDFSSDLNIFGKNSVFQIINRCVTGNGRHILADWFINPSPDHTVIEMRQEAVRECAARLQDIQDFSQTGIKEPFSREHYERLKYWIQQPPPEVSVTRILAPAFTVASVVLIALIMAGMINWPWLIYLIIAGLGITGIFLKKANRQHEYLNNISKPLEILDELNDILNRGIYRSELLKSLQQKTATAEGKSPVKKLASILQSVDVRLNILAAFLLNSLFLWDLHQLNRLAAWKKKHKEQLLPGIEAVCTFDAFFSLGNFAFSYPGYIYPEVFSGADHMPLVKGSNCRHILIPPEDRVGNPVEVKDHGSFIIVTGANMAGKSTYLRTIGLNMIMARLGLPVDCDEFCFRPVRLISSLNTRDSLVKNESFFYAELKRLKYIIDRLENGEHVFCLLDEILKGTNSRDKQNGSIKLLKKLVKLGSSGIIATHDLQIGKLEEEYPGRISNRCFEVEIKDDRLFFDYKLKDGIAQSLNASFLMDKMGIT